MKKTFVILGSILSGAVVGSALTLFCCPKSGKEMRSDAHKLIIDKLNHIHEHIKDYGCKCDLESNEQEL